MVDVDRFKKTLTERRIELAQKIGRIEDRLDAPKDPDSGERATEREEDEMLEAQEKSAAGEIHAIDLALERIEGGVFGICVSCKDPISAERLAAVPHAAVCRNCMGA